MCTGPFWDTAWGPGGLTVLKVVRGSDSPGPEGRQKGLRVSAEAEGRPEKRLVMDQCFDIPGAKTFRLGHGPHQDETQSPFQLKLQR